MKKNLICIAAALVMVLSLSACKSRPSGQGDGSLAATPEPSAAPSVNVPATPKPTPVPIPDEIPVTSAEDFNYKTEDSGVRITEYTGTDKFVSIPDTIDGEPVTSLGNTMMGGKPNAFSGNEELVAVIIPDSITSINVGAFWECTALRSVEIGSGVTTIGTRAFHLCTSLTSIVIPDNVADIWENAFESAPLTSITYKGEEYTGADAFFAAFEAVDGNIVRRAYTIDSGQSVIVN